MSSRLRALPRGLLALYAGTVATRLGTFVVPYLTLYLSQERGLPLSVTGRVIAAGGVGLLFGNFAGGSLADRVGRKGTLLVALALNIVGTGALASGLSDSTAYAMALMSALFGVGMYTPAANAWIADLTPQAQRPLAFTVNYICINVGMGLGPLLGGVLAAASFRWLFLGDIATTLLCVVFIASASSGRRPDPNPSSAPTEGEREPGAGGGMRAELARWTSPSALRLLAFCGASFFVIAPLMALEYAVPLLVGVVLGEPLLLVGVVYSINAACILTFGLPVERLLRARDPLLMMAVAGGLWAVGLTILKLGFSSSALLVCTVVWTLGEIVSSVVIPTYVSRRAAASARARFLALPDAMRSLAGIVAPITLGLIWEQRGVDAVLSLLVATPIVGVLAYLVAWSRTRTTVPSTRAP